MTLPLRKSLSLAALLAGCLLLSACGKEALYSELDEQQANQVMAALMASGINADKETSLSKKGFTVSIAGGDFPAAMQILAASGLPQRRSETMGELFKKESFASSALEEKARYNFGLEEGIRQKLLKVEGVVDAEVQIALPDREPLSGEAPDSSASVMIFQRPGANLADRETDLKVFIKDGIAGLNDVNKVTIKFFTVGKSQAAVQKVGVARGVPAVLSSLSPLAIVITAGIALLLAIVIAVVARMRGGAKARAQQKPQTPVWNG